MQAELSPRRSGHEAGEPRIAEVLDLVGDPPESPDLAARVAAGRQAAGQVGGQWPGHRDTGGDEADQNRKVDGDRTTDQCADPSRPGRSRVIRSRGPYVRYGPRGPSGRLGRTIAIKYQGRAWRRLPLPVKVRLPHPLPSPRLVTRQASRQAECSRHKSDPPPRHVAQSSREPERSGLSKRKAS